MEYISAKTVPVDIQLLASKSVQLHAGNRARFATQIPGV